MFGDLHKSRTIAYSAACIGLIALGGWISIPCIPVPFTLQTLFVLLTGAVMKRYGAVPVALYILLGTLGLPLFHNGMTGPGVLLGPTGGYCRVRIRRPRRGTGIRAEGKISPYRRDRSRDRNHLPVRRGMARHLPQHGAGPGHRCRSRPLRDRRRDQGRCRIPDCRTAAMIAIRSLRHSILAIDSLDIRPGITSVIGPNGSGKTTLLQALCRHRSAGSRNCPDRRPIAPGYGNRMGE